MESNLTDKLDGVLMRLSDIQSSAAALSEALFYTGYEPEMFTGAASLIANDINGAVNDLSKLAEEMMNT